MKLVADVPVQCAKSLTKVYDAPTAFKYLNGIVSLFKPAGVKTKHVRTALQHNLCKDLNELQVREPRSIEKLMLEPGGGLNPVVRKAADLSDHLLAVGPRYQMEDIRCAPVGGLGIHTSGLLLFGINKGLRQSIRIPQNRPIRVYHVIGELGKATETHFADSRITVRSNYRHVFLHKLSGLAASMQASHQRKMYELSGVDLQSQAAYEMACKGAFRPADNSQPVIYGIKLIDFKPPEFTIEVHAINENEEYLATMIHEMGIEMRSVAHCKSIRCIRYGHFRVEDCLLRSNWTLKEVFANIRLNRDILAQHPSLTNQDSFQLK